MDDEQKPPYRVQAKDITSSEAEAIAIRPMLTNADRYVTVLHSPASDYHILDFLGEGTFGDVVKCFKTSTREEVAVKVFKHIDAPEEFEKEVSTLKTLMAFDTDKFNLIQCKSMFVDRNVDRVDRLYMCLEFEMLDINLWDFMNTRPTKCLLVKEIRPILHQLAVGLHFLNSIGLIHADLKPNNIMMVEHVNRPYKVKIIDFGLAQHISETNQGRHFQNRRYRAPEIILGLPYSEAIDVWSLGCIMAELFLGSALFYSTCEYDMLRKIEHILGHFPQRLLNIGLNTLSFYKKERSYHTFRWKLKTPNEYGFVTCTDTFINSLDDLCKIRQVVHLSNEDTTAEAQDQESFVDLLKRLLRPDASQRLIPGQILQHPFVTMAGLALSHANSFYLKLSCEMMQACQNSSFRTEADTSLAPHHETVSTHPTWWSHGEHPEIVGISSRISRGLNLDNLTSDPQMMLSDRLRLVRLHRSPPHDKMYHMEGRPQQKEDQDSVQEQRGRSSMMTTEVAKSEPSLQKSNQMSKSTDRDGNRNKNPDSDQTPKDIPKQFNESSKTSMETAKSSVPRSIKKHNNKWKWKTKPDNGHTPIGKGTLKSRRPSSLNTARDSPITKKRKLNPKDDANTSNWTRTESTAKATEPSVHTTHDGIPTQSQTPKTKRARNWKRSNKSSGKSKATASESKTKPATKTQTPFRTANPNGADTDKAEKKKYGNTAKKKNDKT
ncbi:homeodomain-interacting protein kinase 3-like isoform X2 [Syngnathoides biaculeatus]|uniref:homeodomain-interacting protein kinase 3-like isoform X2 n=1 Tax=Syngnathoides biaculeatus TaxID=300417 RepID=UPI002ADD38B4|nr:homeodomain-interacting protein kinase 3-like isoform X2 [Syngnathoides biaculeatus]